MNKKNYLFDKDQHLWIEEEDGEYYFGITDFAQDQLGDILFVELPEIDSYNSEDYLMSIESDKKDQELFAPFDLEVIEVNESLEDNPEEINEDAYNTWIFKAKLNKDDLEHMSN